MSKNNSLGRGLDSLFSSGTAVLDVLKNDSQRVEEIDVKLLVPNPDQPRHHFDEKALAELAASISEHGILQPIVAIASEHNNYTIIAGERRWRAAQAAGLNTVPVIVRSIDDLQRIELALIENVQREDLSPLDQAMSVQKLHEQFSMGYEQIAKRLGKAYSTVANLIRLMQLPADIQQALHQKQISEGHARALLSLQADPKRQSILFNMIIDKQLSVRQAEQFVVASRKEKASVEKAAKRFNSETDETKKLGKLLGTKISLKYTAKGGSLALHFKDEKQLQQLIDLLATINR